MEKNPYIELAECRAYTVQNPINRAVFSEICLFRLDLMVVTLRWLNNKFTTLQL